MTDAVRGLTRSDQVKVDHQEGLNSERLHRSPGLTSVTPPLIFAIRDSSS